MLYKINNYLASFILLVASISCSKNDLVIHDFMNEENFKTFLESNSLSKQQRLIVIPGSGCGGCISDMENYVISNASNPYEESIFIFTEIGSEKLLKLRLGNKNLNSKRVFFDSKNNLHFRSIYPITIEISSTGRYSISEHSPTNGPLGATFK